MKDRTLYVSDLDGTLLRSDISTSETANRIINDLIAEGMLFSYATARSYVTAAKVTKGLDARFPLIVYNGAMVIDNATGAQLLTNFFGEDIRPLLDDLLEHDIWPITYSFQEGIERFSYCYENSSRGMRDFLDTRKGDPRENAVSTREALYRGALFYVTCIDEKEKLAPFAEKYGQKYRVLFQRDLYTGEQWLEFMPKNASKANAACQLKELLKCSRMVAFGDGINDLDLFAAADECYAVENAVPELKKVATAVIGSNDEDAVANWLLQNVRRKWDGEGNPDPIAAGDRKETCSGREDRGTI